MDVLILWCRSEAKSLAAQRDLIHAGAVQFHAMRNGRKADTTSEALADTERKLNELLALLAEHE